ncbi:DoxX family protein [Cyclobacterium marinum]|uniref:DoxX family protein n=1 Tax=Cyclobacterium marinum (strain ATCC 25205 / DSM 745 / LMG 13164 / NCIMB 1802) TaxID=880070 RepID=G0J799_CYCMS|nr:DoxX family protein [Cyclobacterium marinum]AEL27732.1 DoxX family protein [Cyclobacterium marinum DSM 745]MBI0397496.1 DoxX family protein [Cyclobacterium marinum]MBR9774176.1 DoxX family membrane protein [Cytophagales bacterium]|tara:strand:+ start:74306 stop:74686 length:381 start_codon:yes stop_codon:yes gene_type:complete
MKNKILTVLCILFGLMMINAGLNKFLNYMPMPEMSEEMAEIMGAYATIGWIFPLVAIVEIIGGLLIAIPKTRALGAIVILPVMVGILVHHLVLDPSTLGMAFVLLAINLWAIIANIKKYLPLIKES